MNEAKEPKLSMKLLDTRQKALAERVQTTELFVNTLGAIAERLQTIDEFAQDLVDVREDVVALKTTQTSGDGSQGLNERIAAIEVKLEVLAASTGLIMPDAIDLPKLLAALRPMAGSMWRTPA